MEGLSSLFLNDNFAQKSFTFDDYTINIDALQTAATDYDRTGDVVWPATLLLCDWLVANKANLMHLSSIIELGSGHGLAGILAGMLVQEKGAVVYVTDGDESCVERIARNIDKNSMQDSVKSLMLRWGSDDDLSLLRKQSGFGETALLIGADVIYRQSWVEPMLYSAYNLLQLSGEYVVAFESRSMATERLVRDKAEQIGFVIEELRFSREFPEEIVMRLWSFRKVR